MRTWTTLMIIAFAVGVGFGVPCQANADPGAGEENEYVALHWDGPATTWNWEGTAHPAARATADASVVGDAVAVPGDRVERTVAVRNDGPSDAIATVQIMSVTTTTPASTKAAELEDLIHLFWDIDQRQGEASWAQMRTQADEEGVSHEVSFPVAMGEGFLVRAGYYFPIEATGGMSQGSPSAVLTFNIRIILQDDTSPVLIPTGGYPANPSVAILPILVWICAWLAAYRLMRSGKWRTR